MKELNFGFCKNCGFELRYDYCPNYCGELDIFEEEDFDEVKEAKYCGTTIRVIQEYLFNTANHRTDVNISEDYLKQTIKFLNDILHENK